MIEQHFRIAALRAADKEHDIIRLRKCLQFFHPICHTPANGIVVFKRNLQSPIFNLQFNRLHQAIKPFHALRGLRKEIDRPRKINPLQLLRALNHDCRVIRLTLQPDNLSVTRFAVDNDLWRQRLVVLMLLVASPDPVLQFFYHLTTGQVASMISIPRCCAIQYVLGGSPCARSNTRE